MIKTKFIIIILVAVMLFSCSVSEDSIDISDWTEKSHSNNALPDYSIVFVQNEVIRFDISIDPSDWQLMLDDMENNHGPFGAGSGQGPGGPGGPGGPPPVINGESENPVFVPSSFNFNGKEWYRVGIRFKGNSSLKKCWQSGISKLPFKIDFDEFEDEYPNIADQRFFGFRQLSLSSNYNDTSFLREKITADIFRDAGIRAPQTTFCRVYIDHGNGPVYFGLYTVVEVIDDTMLSDQFGSKEGNCYKPEGSGATFGYNLFSEASFTKKTNETIGDWSDIINLFETLHSETRNSNPDEWRVQLDQVFNTDYFLKWLAVNTVIQNWDTYGKMNHNYYIYNNPADNKLTWIPWDNNGALNEGRQGGALSISLNEVEADWPLIRYLIDDSFYKSIYLSYVKNAADSIFTPEKMTQRYKELHEMIAPYVSGVNGEIDGYTFLRTSSDFENAQAYLINHVYDRQSIVNDYINH